MAQKLTRYDKNASQEEVSFCNAIQDMFDNREITRFDYDVKEHETEGDEDEYTIRYELKNHGTVYYSTGGSYDFPSVTLEQMLNTFNQQKKKDKYADSIKKKIVKSDFKVNLHQGEASHWKSTPIDFSKVMTEYPRWAWPAVRIHMQDLWDVSMEKQAKKSMFMHLSP